MHQRRRMQRRNPQLCGTWALGTVRRVRMCREVVHRADMTSHEQNNAACKDVEGSFECVCSDGYMGNGLSCQDVDECMLVDKNTCHVRYRLPADVHAIQTS